MSCPLALLDERLQVARDLPYVFVACLDPGDMSNISAVMRDQLDLEGEVFHLDQWAGIGAVRIFSKSPKTQLAALTGSEVWKG